MYRHARLYISAANEFLGPKFFDSASITVKPIRLLEIASERFPYHVPTGTYVLDLWLSVLCMHSKAWLAARVSLRLARLPRTASSAQRSRRLCSTRAAAPVLLAHADVTENIKYFLMGPKLRHPAVGMMPIKSDVVVS